MLKSYDELIQDNERLKAQTLEMAGIIRRLQQELAEERRARKANSALRLGSAAMLVGNKDLDQTAEQHLLTDTGKPCSAKTVAGLANVGTVPLFDDPNRLTGHLGRANDTSPGDRSETAAHKAFRFLNAIVDHIPIAFHLKSVKDGYRVVIWNKAAQALYGLSREETLGRTMHDLWPKADADRMHAADLQLVAGGAMQDFPDRITQTKNRGTIHVHMRKFPLKDDNGAVTHVLFTAVDITDRLATEARLRQSQELFRSLTHLTSDWYWETDDQFRFRQVAADWSDQFKGLAGDYIGKTRWELDDTLRNQAAWLSHRAQLDKRETFRDFEYERVDKDGRLVVICISGEPIIDANGRFCGYRGVGTDVSVRKQTELALRSSEARFRAVVAALAEGVLLCDEDGLITDCNASAERILGRTLAQMKGQRSMAPGWEVLGKDGLPLLEDEWPTNAAMQTGLAQSGVAIHYRKPDGSDFWVSVNVGPLFDEAACTPSGFVCTLSDITQRKRARLEITRLNVNLENRVQRRTAQLEMANQELEAFSYSVAHDLRAPLNTLSGFSVLLEKSLPSDSGERTRHCLARIQNAVRHMGALTDGLLSLAHLSRTRLTWSTVDISALATMVARQIMESDPTRVAHITVEPGLAARADPALLRQVLENLLANAWKFTSKKPCTEISVGQELDADGQPVYFVKDNGAGFDMAFADKLFGIFERLHLPSEFAGSGIGLATVKRIITRHEGTIWATSSVDAGSTFYFTLPSDQAGAVLGESRLDEDANLARLPSSGARAPMRSTALGNGAAIAPLSPTASDPDGVTQSNEQFRHAFEYAAIGMTLLSINKRRLRVNLAFCRMLGYSEAELLARTVQDITHPDDVQEDARQSQRAVDGEIEAYQREKRYFHQSGRIVWVYLSCSLVRDADRQPLHFISQIQDITERKQAEQLLQLSDARFRALTSLTSDWFWEQDENYRFVQILGEASHPVGVGWNTVIGKTRWELNQEPVNESVWAAHKAQLERREVFHDFPTTHIDVHGQVHHWRISGMPIFDASGRFAGYRGIGRDDTQGPRL
jgi:PAS domain S-box-containing protein